jgi:hypothetical protein
VSEQLIPQVSALNTAFAKLWQLSHASPAKAPSKSKISKAYKKFRKNNSRHKKNSIDINTPH